VFRGAGNCPARRADVFPGAGNCYKRRREAFPGDKNRREGRFTCRSEGPAG
jgi:hypothetical protein